MSIVKLLTHRVTFRFLVLLGTTLGLSLLNEDTIGGLEATVCSVLTCSP